MGELYLDGALDRDLVRVARDLRPEDRREVETCGRDPLVAMREARAIGETRSIVLGDEAIAVFGWAPNGYIWLLATEEILDHRMAFLRGSLAFINHFPHKLWTFADIRNKEHIRWLEWLGFSAEGCRLVQGVPFPLMTKEAPNV